MLHKLSQDIIESGLVAKGQSPILEYPYLGPEETETGITARETGVHGRRGNPHKKARELEVEFSRTLELKLCRTHGISSIT